jgi:ribose transport system permease protein
LSSPDVLTTQNATGVGPAGSMIRNGVRGVLARHTFVFALVLAVGLLIVTLATESGGFGLTNQLADFAPIALASMASAPAIISGGGGLDLSISPLIFFASAVYGAWLVPHGLGGVEAIPIVLAVGLVAGACNGAAIIVFRVQPVVVTLSTYFILIGVDLAMVQIPITLHSNWLTHLATSVGPVPGGILTIGAPLLLWWALGRVPYRSLLYAVGSNDATAFSSGVNVPLIRLCAYALGGLIAAIGGLALTALVTSVNSSQAAEYTLLAIAGVALGGTPLTGGRGGLFGSMVGASCIYLLSNLLTQAQINPSWLQVMYGGALLVAVVISGITLKDRR